MAEWGAGRTLGSAFVQFVEPSEPKECYRLAMDSLEKRRRNQAAAISAREIAQILERALPGRVLTSFELLNGSATNLSYLLRLEGMDARVVLRICTRDPSACRREVQVLGSVSKLLPVPEFIYANPDGEGDVGPHALYRYIEGMTFQELKSRGNLQDMAEAAYAIGAALARLQTVSLAWPASAGRCPETAGELLNSPVLEQRLGGRGRDHLCDFIHEWLPRIRQLDQDRALVHGDFGNRNTLVNRGALGWVVAGILDWECAFSGSPLWDAARFICFERRARPCREPHFSRGFCENGGSLPKDWGPFARAMNVATAMESLSRADLPERFVPDLRELVAATLEDRDLS